ncbi:hypothetical protein GCM10023221_02650 [Luteimicrobium xylanilyticum]|uniref:Ribonuclease E n=1 Tax=Luteimicrobium xylanilyticum TaxID=1133546 RepID=A0A5P9Q7T4_9MICO|nr:NYN domain-containing protein [Luteimicrobium xylanilyticum]QFU97439.1 Ribonuclease E [Luteimicrobium xylanilyticum]
MDTEERLAVFLDYENLALGAREHLGGMTFDFGPIADALAVRGRVVVRRAYADWSYFDEDRRALTRHQVELIEMPQRMGASRKNAADIKMVVDAIEMAFERDYISTFVMCTGDSDFSPLVHKLRELNKRVIGVGVELSTSRLLPPACDEFLFYDRLEGVDVPEPGESKSSRSSSPRPARRGRAKAKAAPDDAAETAVESPSSAEQAAEPAATEKPEKAATKSAGARRSTRKGSKAEPPAEPVEPEETPTEDTDDNDDQVTEGPTMEVRVAQTLADLESSTSGDVTASALKRALLRKDPTFSESEYGFRSFGEFVRYLADRGIVELGTGPAAGDPSVSLPAQGDTAEAFAFLRSVVAEDGGSAAMSGLKDQLRKRRPAFSEKALGFRGFLQFCKAAAEAGAVDMRWDDDEDAYILTVS